MFAYNHSKMMLFWEENVWFATECSLKGCSSADHCCEIFSYNYSVSIMSDINRYLLIVFSVLTKFFVWVFISKAQSQLVLKPVDRQQWLQLDHVFLKSSRMVFQEISTHIWGQIFQPYPLWHLWPDFSKELGIQHAPNMLTSFEKLAVIAGADLFWSP